MSHVDIGDFERMYQRDRDPWSFETSEYEQRRYDLTVAALVRPRYRRGFEPGCAIGESRGGWPHAATISSPSNLSATALGVARERCARSRQRRADRGRAPWRLTDGVFDLVVLREIGYYFEVPELLQPASVPSPASSRGHARRSPLAGPQRRPPAPRR